MDWNDGYIEAQGQYCLALQGRQGKVVADIELIKL
jgi:hypothetical protein